MPTTSDRHKRLFTQPASEPPKFEFEAERKFEAMASTTVRRIHHALIWSMVWGITLPALLGLTTSVHWNALIGYALGTTATAGSIYLSLKSAVDRHRRFREPSTRSI